MSIFDIVWWAAWGLIAFGIVVYFLGAACLWSAIDHEKDDGESAVLFAPLIIFVAILIGTGVGTLLLWLLFYLVRYPTLDSLGDIVRWIIYIAFWGQFTVSAVWGITSLCNASVRCIHNWRNK
jgi:hypothetical protein